MVAEVFEPDKVATVSRRTVRPYSGLALHVVREPTTPSAVPPAVSQERKGPAPGSAEYAIEYATAHTEAFRSAEGEAFVIFDDGDSGRPVRHTGGSRSPAVGRLTDLVYAECGRYCGADARATVGYWLDRRADEAEPREVLMRSAWDGQRLVVDIGDPAGRVFIIDSAGWHYADSPPAGVHLRRSSVTAALPIPADVGDLDALWTLVPVAEADRALVLALMLVAWMQGTAQPVVFWTGPQDAGKTVTVRCVLRFVDPVSNLRGRSLPTSEADWKAAVAPYLVVLIDNVSGITAAQSDMLCKVATGGEATARALYTDDTAHISSLHAPLHLTSIGVGALRGDLASRLVRLELPAITPERRRTLSDLQAAQEEAAPRIMRGLLDLAVQVLGVLPGTDRTHLRHRLTDFEVLVRAIDTVLGSHGAARLAVQADGLAEDVIDGDPVARSLVAAVASGRLGDGRTTPGALLEVLSAVAGQEATRSPGWPRTPRILWDHLTRVAPALLATEGIEVVRGGKSNGVRHWLVTKTEQASS